MKRNNSFFSCLILFLVCNFSVIGQEIAPFQFEEVNAIEIDENVMRHILDKIWHCNMRKYTERKVVRNLEIGRGEMTVSSDGLVYFNGKEGSWYVDDNKLLVFEFDREDLEHNSDLFMVGAFSILKAESESLIFRKNLTSKFDNEFTYFFETPEKHAARIKAKAEIRRKQQWRIHELRTQIRTEREKLGLPYDNELHYLSEEELTEELNKLRKN